MLIAPKMQTVLQTQQAPMVSLDVVEDHAAAVRQLIVWDCVGVLFDRGPIHGDLPSAVVVVLVQQEVVVGAVRVCLSVPDSVAALQAYRPTSGKTELRCLQGRTIAPAELVDLEKLTAVWHTSVKQSAPMSIDDLSDFFDRIDTYRRDKGRRVGITLDTRRQVWFDAHGRCMFEGCGRDLAVDPTTGQRGNFASLAHNVASSESGPRGVLYLSGRLANDANNILLLCDTHHRLVDVIARADYPASRLSEMRQRFCRDARGLLDGLSKTPIPVYCLTWPVRQQVISAPSSLQISQALAPIGARLDGQPNILSDNDAVLQSADPNRIWDVLLTAIDIATDRILMQAQTKGYRAALFAMGLMPALIALGAKIGNKCEITPMLRFRESGLWYWPAIQPRGEFYSVDGLEHLSNDEREISLRIALTAAPQAMDLTARRIGYPQVSVAAHSELMGNGALGHPVDGYRFRQRMQELLHRLRDRHGVERVHLLPCASNAACVFFGQAFDSYHPELIVYDFDPNGHQMVARLRIHNVNNKCSIEAPHGSSI